MINYPLYFASIVNAIIEIKINKRKDIYFYIHLIRFIILFRLFVRIEGGKAQNIPKINDLVTYLK